MKPAESVEEAWECIEQGFTEEEAFERELTYCLTDPVANDFSWESALDILNGRCCGTGEEYFLIGGQLWLIAYSYGH